MKEIIIALGFILCTNFCFAQGNLQFNRSVFFQADTTINCLSGACVDSFLIKDIIVPNGKVLKVESININIEFGTGFKFYLNSVSLYNLLGSFSFVPNAFPIWLPEGTYRLKIAGHTTNDLTNAKFAYHLSALEFNIVP